MLNQPTLEKLHAMTLHGMAEAFRAQLESADFSQLSFEERFALLVDQQGLWKENRALARRLRAARLKERGLEEVFLRGVCRRTVTEAIEITDRFWPYERVARDGAEGPRAYVERVKRVFLERACVESAFTAADERHALDLYARGAPLQDVERAIRLGSLRKYVSLGNRQGGTPITSLHYFTLLFEEVRQEKIPEDYGGYIAMKGRKIERQWPQSTRETK